jgi:sugar/nucleoside kinase (ribokinase family)
LICASRLKEKNVFLKGFVMEVIYDVCGVGNAIVDVIAPATDEFLSKHEIAKGAMTLIFDEPAVEKLYGAMNDAKTVSGGSGANSLAGIASLGGKAAYIGKVSNDALGDLFKKEINEIGVTYDTAPHIGGPATARCMINVTPDGQRSMCTYLGCSPLMDDKDLDEAKIGASKIIFLEGYLFDRDEAKAAFVHAAEIAKKYNRKVALTLSDLFCVSRHKESFLQLVKNHIDILFANEAEILALYDENDFDAAFKKAAADCEFVAITRSEKGSVLTDGKETISVRADPIDKVIDTTGAGDLYAAGVLYGIATGRELETCGKLGSMCAAEIISHFGPRPEANLAQLAAAKEL